MIQIRWGEQKEVEDKLRRAKKDGKRGEMRSKKVSKSFSIQLFKFKSSKFQTLYINYVFSIKF